MRSDRKRSDCGRSAGPSHALHESWASRSRRSACGCAECRRRDRRAHHRDRETPSRRRACACGSPDSCGVAAVAGITCRSSASNRHGDGLQWWCRSCFAAYFRDRGDAHRRQSYAARLARQRALRGQVLDHLRHHPCVVCGEADPVVLEFDHLDEKIASISVLMSRAATRSAVEAEIARCEVVCTNCHRRRTATRAGWRRASVPEAVTRPYPSLTVERNLTHV